MEREYVRRRELKTSSILGVLLLLGGVMFLADTLYVIHAHGAVWGSLCKAVVFSGIGVLVLRAGRMRG